jgi:hypothetical protein
VPARTSRRSRPRGTAARGSACRPTGWS